MPQGLQLLIDAQFEQLNSDVRRLLEVASIVGVTFSAATVASLLALDVTQVESRCDALVDHEQFLQAHGAEKWPDGTLSGRYRFTHTLYREAIDQRLSAAYRLRCQQRLSTLLETIYSQPVDSNMPRLSNPPYHAPPASLTMLPKRLTQ